MVRSSAWNDWRICGFVLPSAQCQQLLTDTFTATTVDGTQQLVTITINGANDAAVIKPVSRKASTA